MAQNNTTQDGAWEATVGPATHAYNSGLVSNVGYLRDYDGDVDDPGYYRHAWWRYRPVTAGSTSVSANGSVPGSGATIKLFIFKLVDNALTSVAVVSMTTVHNLTVAPGDVYYFVIEQDINSVASQYWLNVSGQLTARPINDEAFYRSTIIVDPGGGTFEAAPTPTDQLFAGNPDPDNGGTLQNDAWWKMTLTASGTVVFKPSKISGTANVWLTLYTYDPTLHVYDFFDECPAGNTLTYGGVPTGFRLFAQMAVKNGADATATYRLSVTAPRCVEPNNHQYDDAYLVTFRSDGTYVGYVNTSNMLAAETPPPGLGAGIQGTKGAWYKLRPANTGMYSSQATGGAGAPGTYLGLYRLSAAGAWSTVQLLNLGDGGKLNAQQLFAGNYYYWRTSDTAAGSQDNTITITRQPKAPHHQYANALPLQSDAPKESSSVVVTPDWDVSDLFATETAPPGFTLTGHNGIWYTYVPAASKNGLQNPFDIQAFTNDTSGATGRLTVWSVTNGVWTMVWQTGSVAMSDTSGPIIDSLSIVQGTRYYIRFWTPNSMLSVRLRFRYLPPPGVEGTVSPNNHQAANATQIVPQLDGTWAETHSNVNYDDVEVLPPGTLGWGSQAMWWTFTPTASTPAGTVKFLTESQTYGHTVLLYDSTVEPWVEVDWVKVNTASYPTSTSISPALTAGVNYYYRAANYRAVLPPDGSGQTMRLALQGAVLSGPSDPTAVCPPIVVNTWCGTPVLSAQPDLIPAMTVHVVSRAPVDFINPVPPMTLSVTLAQPVSPEPAIVIPAITAHVAMPIGNNLYGTSVNPIRARVRIGLPATAEASIALSNPDAGQIVANFFPVFVVGLTAADDYAQYQIQIEYSADATFATSTVVTLDAPVVDGGVTYTPTAPVPATTYWRARLLETGEQVAPWTPSRSFQVRVVITATSLPVTWAVSAVAVRPIHLWHFEPAGVEEGDLVTLYGQGFTTTVGSLTMYGQPIAALSWDLVAQNPLATPADRVIDGDLVDPEHFAVTFIAPPVEEPGGPITVGA